MRTIRISSEVWEALKKVGQFGETPDRALRRVLNVNGGSNGGAAAKQRIATIRMTRRVEGGRFMVEFAGGPTKSWALPEKNDKAAIRRVRDAAVKFARKNKATDGQVHAVMKGLTEAGYHLRK